VRPLTDTEPDECDDVLAADVRGVYLVCRALLPPVIAAGRGDVVNIASASAGARCSVGLRTSADARS
jgi:NAD(P)-dependent dehydrogenase (short-subunit alcohol dehydrogenase family)